VSISGTLVLDIVKPEGRVLSEQVEECVVPGAEGYFGILAGHTPFIAQLGVGEVMYRQGSERRYLVVDGGFCEVRPHSVTILAERAERAEEIDLGRATRTRDRAREHLASVLQAGKAEEIERVRHKLQRAETRLQVAGKRPGART